MNKNKSIEIATRLSLLSLIVSIVIFVATIGPIGTKAQIAQGFALILLVLSAGISIALLIVREIMLRDHSAKK